jgi:epoxyqueuosine reductase
MHETTSVTSASTEGEPNDLAALVNEIKDWGRELGFAEVGVASADVSGATSDFMHWLHQGRHGAMHYMAKHAALRAQPSALVPGTLSVITARLPYWPDAHDAQAILADATHAYISRYALGRDYHKTVRQRLQRLAERVARAVATRRPGTPFAWRVFSDSAPVMEVEFARQAGIGWRGKHSLTLTRGGSWHFLGEIYCTLPLPADAPIGSHCGRCTRCIDACPTGAIVAPYQVDARLCISYLTIELPDAIPLELRPLIGNRIYGCDDCQLCCPWNRYAHIGDPDFATRAGLDSAKLVDLFAWNEEQFETRLAGNPIRRIGHVRWLRNIAVALGNCAAAPSATSDLEALRGALASRLAHPSALVREHVAWALEQAPRA